MAQIILNKTSNERANITDIKHQITENSVSYFQKVIKKNKNNKQNVELNDDINQPKLQDTNSNLNNQMTQLIDSRNSLLDTKGSTESYMPRPVNPSS